MLNKLLKYDLKYMIKNMSIFYILALFFSITTRIFFSLEQTVFINIIGQVSVGCMFSMVASILFNTILRSWVRFKDSLYKDESYLTHTLPVSKKQLYESKFLDSIVFTIVGFIFMILCLFITYYTPERWDMLNDIINSMSIGLNINSFVFIMFIILVFFLEIINLIQSGFLGIILGYKRNNSKIGFSLLYGFISYMVSQGMLILIILMIGLFDSSIMSIFNSNVIVDKSLINKLFVISIISYSFIIFIMNTICYKSFKKGVNVE